MMRNDDAAPAEEIARVWLSVDEASRHTGVSKTELYVALQSGNLLGSQRGKHKKWRVHVRDLDAWMRGTNTPAA